MSLGNSPEHGFQYPETDYFLFLVCTFYTPRTSGLIAYCPIRLFYVVEFSAYYGIQCESGREVALFSRGTKSFNGISPLPSKRESRSVHGERTRRSRRRFT